MKNLYTIKVFSFFISIFSIITWSLCLFGCIGTSHYDSTKNFQFLWKIGDLDQAEEEAARLAQEGPKRDRLLYFLEEGAVSRMNSNTDQSIPALNQAALEYDRWFGPHLRS